MKIVGYCALWAIVLALLVSMCAIIKEGRVVRPDATDSDVVAGKVAGHSDARPSASKHTLNAALPAA
jgi:hypothetical protein